MKNQKINQKICAQLNQMKMHFHCCDKVFTESDHYIGQAIENLEFLWEYLNSLHMSSKQFKQLKTMMTECFKGLSEKKVRNLFILGDLKVKKICMNFPEIFCKIKDEDLELKISNQEILHYWVVTHLRRHLLLNNQKDPFSDNFSYIKLEGYTEFEKRRYISGFTKDIDSLPKQCFFSMLKDLNLECLKSLVNDFQFHEFRIELQGQAIITQDEKSKLIEKFKKNCQKNKQLDVSPKVLNEVDAQVGQLKKFKHVPKNFLTPTLPPQNPAPWAPCYSTYALGCLKDLCRIFLMGKYRRRRILFGLEKF